MRFPCRACGEHLTQTFLVYMITGSSPRLRGTPEVYGDAIVSVRFIPAPAGNTAIRRGAGFCQPVHPRACGEHPGAARTTSPVSGSSPRLRGTHVNPVRDRAAERFIPAPAGNTGVARVEVMPAAVHPRACGEHNNPEEYENV